MCIAFWTLDHPSLAFIFAANRDEYLARPAEAAQWRTMRSSKGKEAEVLCGVDLQEGGTWLGLSRLGRFAILTNFREAKEAEGRKESRGHLVRDVLIEGEAALEDIDLRVFRGFSMLYGQLGGRPRLRVITNRPDLADNLGPYDISDTEILGSLSNDHYGKVVLDNMKIWPKIRTGGSAFRSVVDQSAPSLDLEDADARSELVDRLFGVTCTAAPTFESTNPETIKETVSVPPLDLVLPTSANLYGTRPPDHPDPKWYATRSQVVLLVDRKGRAFFTAREANVIGPEGRPIWSGKESGSWSLQLPP